MICCLSCFITLFYLFFPILISPPQKFFAAEARARRKGGVGGIPPRPSRSPAALHVQSRTPTKSFVFLLEEKIGREQNQKCEQNFSLVWRVSASSGGAEQVSFAQSRFGLCHIIVPELNFQKFCRRDWPRFALLNRETLARRARRDSPRAGSKSLAILSIYFARKRIFAK